MQETYDLFASPTACSTDQGAGDAAAAASQVDEPHEHQVAAEGRLTLARRLYDECQSSKPDWEQLGGETKGVWLERADRMLAGDLEPWRLRPVSR